ncbi:hypothetical protein [Halobellus ruber]|uniref:Uncharacterized protein n=1 Tax=Halobellus ruber TaxID=2761102 RepID=A0A7J9SM88_9EURY|nr:hypothetical protein [Halobellus ruber]MBB6647117.1 hypothetical protein [Halobellus ruber]
MGATDGDVEYDNLLTHVLVNGLGFGALSTALPVNVPPLYLYAATFVVLDFGVVNTYFHVFTGRSHGFVQNPFSLAIPAAVLIAAAGVRYMTATYRQALDQMDLRRRSDRAEHPSYAGFEISRRTRATFYIVVLGGYYLYIVGIIGLSSYVETFGVVSTAAFAGVIYPLGYVPIAVDFVMQFASIQFVLPVQLTKIRPTPAFLDPRNLGGFYPIGELFKRTYYVYTAGLLLYLVYIYGPPLTGLGTAAVSRVGTVEAGFFTALWLLGLVAVGSSMFTVHRLMASEKDSHLSQLEQQLHDIVTNPYDISSAKLHDNPEVEQIQRRIEQVRSMREYPTTVNTSLQLLVSLLAPEVINLLLNSVS